MAPTYTHITYIHVNTGTPPSIETRCILRSFMDIKHANIRSHVCINDRTTPPDQHGWVIARGKIDNSDSPAAKLAVLLLGEG